jgi:hypothetical protein
MIQLAIPTDSSKILPGFYLFIGFVLASLFMSWKLERRFKPIQAPGGVKKKVTWP